MLLIPAFFRSGNKQYMYTVEGMDEAGFKQAMTFCAVDFSLEVATFLAMTVFIKVNAELDILRILVCYFDHKQVFWQTLWISCCVTIASFAFFMMLYGLDPSFSFDAFDDEGGNANSTVTS